MRISTLLVSLLWLAIAGVSRAAVVVSITKTVDDFSPKVLDTFRYYVTVDSLGGTATGVTVTDLVPAGLQVMGISNGGTLSGGTITWNLPNMSCVPQVVTLTVFSDVSGSWLSFTDVAASDNVRAASTVGGVVQNNTNWFLVNALTGYAVNTVTSVKVYYEYYNDTAADTISTQFNNNGDLSTFQGATNLTAGSGLGADATQVWDITALGGGWTLPKLQQLAIYMQHAKGSGGGGHNAFIDNIYVVVTFQSCGTSVYFDAKVTNALKNGDALNNSATISGSNFSAVSSTNVSSTVRGPTIALTKTARPALVAPGDTVNYTIDFKNQVSGISIYDDFNDNFGTGGIGTIAVPAGIIPNWAGNESQTTSWSNVNGVFSFAPCGYQRAWRTDVPDLSNQTIAVDFQLGASGESASIMFLNQVNSGSPAIFYKSKLYLSGDGYYHVDVQSSSWNQVCGNTVVPGSNTAAWAAAWHNLQVVVKNYVFYVYVDGNLVFTCDDPTNFITNPGVPGVYNDGGCTLYDNYRVGDDIPAYNVVVSDTLNPCLTYLGSSPAATVSGNLLSWNVGNLQGGQTGSVTVQALVNTCAVGSVVPNLANSFADNAQIAVSLNAPITVVMPITKAVSPGSANPLDTVTYTMVYTATGGGPIVADDFSTAWGGRWITQMNKPPANWSITAGILDVNGGMATDQFTAIGTDGVDGMLQSDIYMGEAKDNGLLFGYQGGKYYYVAFYLGSGAGDDYLRLYYFDGTTNILKQQIGPIVIDPTNGSASTASATPVPVTAIRAGNQFRVTVNGSTYTLIDATNALPGPGVQGYYENTGDWRFDNFRWEPGYKAAIVISDTLPANMSYVSGCCGATLTGNVVSWNLPNLSVGQSATVTMLLQVSATASGIIYNTAQSASLGGVIYNSGAIPLTITGGTPTPTRTATRTATRTPSATPSSTPSHSPSPTATRTPSATPSITPSNSPSPTVTRTGTPSRTPSATPSITPTASPTNTPSPSPTRTASPTRSVTSSVTPTVTPSVTPSFSPTQSATRTVTPTVTQSVTASFSPSQSVTRTITPTSTPSVTPSFSPTQSATSTSTPTVTQSVTASFSPSQSVTRTITPTATPSASPSFSPTQSVTSTISSTATQSVTASFSPSQTMTQTYTPTSTMTATPSATPSVTSTFTVSPINSPTITPTVTRTATPSVTASATPTATLTATQSITFTVSPTATPSSTPSWTPTATPTATPSFTESPFNSPTITPTATQTGTPSATASATPTATPSATQSITFTASATDTPSATPTQTPTATPTATPSFTESPINSPTITLTASPSSTVSPTLTATRTDTASATVTPSATVSSSPVDTPTAIWSATQTPLATATPTFTESQTYTVTPTYSPTRTPAPYNSRLVLSKAIYPNPFSEAAHIYYVLSENASVKLSIFNVAGEPICTQEAVGLAGKNLMKWNGNNSDGSRCSSGVYILQFKIKGIDGRTESFWETAVVAR